MTLLYYRPLRAMLESIFNPPQKGRIASRPGELRVVIGRNSL
jgi:hypothetical protein